MFYGKFNEGKNILDNPSIFSLSPDLQPLRTKSDLKICGFYLPGSVIVFSIPEIIYLSTTKQNSQVLNIFELFPYDKTVIAFI
jgi:hypothetical protein